MPVYQVDILNEQGKTVLSSIPMHVSGKRAHCILWGKDCKKVNLTDVYRLSFRDGRMIDCSVTEIQISTVERSEVVEFKLADQE